MSTSAPARGSLHIQSHTDAARLIGHAQVAADEGHEEVVGASIIRGRSIADDRHARVVADPGGAVMRRLRDAERMASRAQGGAQGESAWLAAIRLALHRVFEPEINLGEIEPAGGLSRTAERQQQRRRQHGETSHRSLLQANARCARLK